MRSLGLILVLVPALASADPTIGEEVIRVTAAAPVVDMGSTGETITVESTGVLRGIAQGFLVLGEGQEVSAEWRLLTTSQPFGAAPIALTDFAILTMRGRTAITHKADLFFSVDLLPKQPSDAENRLFQSASAGLMVQPWNKPLALWMQAAAGTLIEDRGSYGQAAVGLEVRKRMHEIVGFEGGVSMLGTKIYASPTSWMAEAAVKGALQFHDPRGWTGGWVGFAYSLPVADGGMLDPQPRLDLSLGVVLSFIDHWDLFVKYAVIDRGDTAPNTQLPILDGGFDQRQAVVGVTYHTQ
jgi:hypothetical protein